MEKMIMMTETEYEELQNEIEDLGNRLVGTQEDLLYEQYRADKLWDLLNRPAIEALQAKHDAEYYDWCEEIAEKYDRLDEEEWITDRAKWYNNGLHIYAETYGYKNATEVYEDRKYLRGCDMTSFCCWDGESAEGWSDLPYYRTGNSWIMSRAKDDAWNRYEKSTGKSKEFYGHLWETFYDMYKESYCLGNDCHEFYR